MTALVRCSALLLVCLLAIGCGAKKVTVKGKVTRKGEPLKVSKTGYVSVTLIPADKGEKYTTIPIRAESDGSFTAKDVPVGEYKIAIEQFDPNPQTDALAGRFAPAATQIKRKIDGKSEINIDLDKPEG